MQAMWNSSWAFGDNAAYIEMLYEQYLVSPETLSDDWRLYFDQIAVMDMPEVSHQAIIERFREIGKKPPYQTDAISDHHDEKEVAVQNLIEAYRVQGHQNANLDPLGLALRLPLSELNLSYYGLTDADMDDMFHAGTLTGPDLRSLRDIVSCLKSTYCGSIGSEFMHIVDSKQRVWIQEHLEHWRGQINLSIEERLHILKRLNAAEGLEKYLAAKYPGTKRFGLEGGESLIPLLDTMILQLSTYSVREVVIGMAHRGRLNVLVNIFGKKTSDLFDEFEGLRKTQEGLGDVKYHQGFSSDLNIDEHIIHLALAFNPSHLEIVSPVVQGSVRARQDKHQDFEKNNIIPIAIHGDAAFSGQGVVMETFQMSQTRAYKTGGTLHIIVNNQVGFTTSCIEDARSTEYPTDVAKMIQAPIFHVNGDDPEAVAYVTRLAVDYRMAFKKDVVIDLVCYRRLGHNEADEPFGTQPLMYQQIKKQKTTYAKYIECLLNDQIITSEESTHLAKAFRHSLESGQSVVPNLINAESLDRFHENWLPYLGKDWTYPHDTRVDLIALKKISHQLCVVPKEFVMQNQVKKIMQDRQKMADESLPLNWGMAELLAYATLLSEGYSIRLTGQDVGRGTFAHRHAVLHNQKKANTYISLSHLDPSFKGKVDIYDSLLSEEAVLAFEYGYSATVSKTLVIWEAQFGDFANGAQVVIDQFITSGEIKWGRLSGLTMLLPHGYEGQGSEHSSARLERFLQLAAQQNIQICIPTTPAQVFHMLRRQIIRPIRKPLIVFSPKSLLRHKRAVSTLNSLSNQCFEVVIDEVASLDRQNITRIVLCSGKVYYDLLKSREESNLKHLALIRIEQLYPFPIKELVTILSHYMNIKELIWCQEEPKNQGGWYCLRQYFDEVLVLLDQEKTVTLQYVGRHALAAPACGYLSTHLEEQNLLVKQALGDTK